MLVLKTESWSLDQDSLTCLPSTADATDAPPLLPPPSPTYSLLNYSTKPVLFSSPRLLFILYYTILCRKPSAAEGPTTSGPPSFYGVFKGLEVLQEISLFLTTVNLTDLGCPKRCVVRATNMGCWMVWKQKRNKLFYFTLYNNVMQDEPKNRDNLEM